MKYTKPALSYEQQAQHLLDQGLIADKSILVDRLKMVNYYRLSAYWYNFKVIDPQTKKEGFSPDTKFDMVWRRYTFDRELRLLIMGAIEHVEVAILRTRLVSQFALTHGPFGYVDLANFNPKFYSENHARLLGDLETAINTSNEEFIGRFRGKYTGESNLPLWIAVEVMTFGQLFTMFRFLDRSDLQPIAREFNLYPPVMISWLHTLLFIRNSCAHHARL
jgi:abortive infection bacteriophage resistance protein